MADKQYFCTVANDGVAVCVCKYRPCEKLKRKEQECEYWKHQAELGSETTDRLAKQLQEKEQECEKFKKGYEELFAYNNELINDKLQIGLKRNRYKQALDEIEKLCKDETCEPCKELEENDHCDECHNRIILEIISEAKEQ